MTSLEALGSKVADEIVNSSQSDITTRALWDYQAVNLSAYRGLIESGALLRLAWSGDVRLDYVALDNSEPSVLKVVALRLASAVAADGRDLASLIATGDGRFAILDPGMPIRLTITAPTTQPRGVWSFVFEVTGYYEPLVQS